MAYRPTRREVMAGAGALALSGSSPPHRSATARGVVFEDRRGGGRRRTGDPGIAGVIVSNGRAVTLTGADGGWSLPVEPGESVFVIEPPDWAAPPSPGGVPRFSYLHEPAGPPPASVDFPLLRREEDREFEALLVTDTQPENVTELGYVRDAIVAAMLEVGAAFGINHGDVVADDLSLYPRYLRILDATGIPWHHCPGNHDIDRGAPDDRHSRETWKRTFGPRHYAFQHGQATFLVLDNVEYLGEGKYRGAFGPRQLAFVRNVLRHVPPEHLVVLSMHVPLRCYLDPANPADTTADWRELLRLLSGHPHAVSFAGHLHATEHHYLPGAGAGPHHHHVLTAASGSWWSGPSDHRGIPFADSTDGTPNGFHVLSVAGNRYTTRFVPAATKTPAQLRVIVDGPHRRAGGPAAAHRGAQKLGLSLSRDGLRHSRVLANVFDGGPRTRASFELVGRTQPTAMERVATPDPLMLELFSGNAPRKAWVAAVRSSHIWQGPLPGGLDPGAHVLLVRALDEYGREHVARAVIEVTPA